MYLVASVGPSVCHCCHGCVGALIGAGQIYRERHYCSFWCAVVDIRGSALPSAAKSKEESLSVKVFVCVLSNREDAVDRLLIFMGF